MRGAAYGTRAAGATSATLEGVWRMAMLLALIGACTGAQPPQPTGAERAAYDRYRRPERVIAALGLRPDEVVADVGAGAGYLTHRLARAVGPRGLVVATDIDPSALAQIGPATVGEAPIETRCVRADDPGLEPGAYDLVLMAEVDHLLPDRAAYLRRLARALSPRGRIAVSNRRLYRAPLVDAARRAGLRLVGESTALPAHFLVLLEAAR